MCAQCPWRERCLSQRHGRQQEFPVAAQKKARRSEERTIFILRFEDRIAIRRRSGKGLLAGLYEFPNVEGYCRREELPTILQQLLPGLQEELPAIPGKVSEPLEAKEKLTVQKLPEARHIFSHIEWQMRGYEIRLPRLPEAKGIIWATQEELDRRYSIPSAFSAYKPH